MLKFGKYSAFERIYHLPAIIYNNLINNNNNKNINMQRRKKKKEKKEKKKGGRKVAGICGDTFATAIDRDCAMSRRFERVRIKCIYTH